MTALQVEMDGVALVTIALDGNHVLDVSVTSSLHEGELARLEVIGGTYGEDVVDGHRIWIGDRLLAPGQTVRVSLIESEGPFDAGQTMRELYPEDESPTEFDFTITEEKVAELRARPKLRKSFSMQVGTGAGAPILVESTPQDDQFRFSVVWDYTRPQEARLGVRTYCFEDVIARQPGQDHLSGKLAWGDSAFCTLVA